MPFSKRVQLIALAFLPLLFSVLVAAAPPTSFSTAKTLLKQHVYFDQNENGFLFCICGGDGFDEFFAEFKSTLSVKGGGRNGMAQGTVNDDKKEIEKFFADKSNL